MSYRRWCPDAWIDGQNKRAQTAADEASYWLQKFTPRGPKSIWSRRNTEKAERLIAQGEMRPPGMRAIEAAKLDGRWQAAYAGQKKMEVPEDLEAALAKNKKRRTSSGRSPAPIAMRYSFASKPPNAPRPA